MRSPVSVVPARADRLRGVRYLWRVPVLLLVVTVAVPLGLLVLGLPMRPRSAGHEPLGQRVVRFWSRALLRGAFGFRIRAQGAPLPGAALLVANHVSWMDIELVHTQRAACFVAKAEIARWPLVGWLAARGGTIFHRRGNPASLSAVMATMVQRLRQGRCVAVFPEGGIEQVEGGLAQVRTFHARVFQCALDADVPVQPLALSYCRDGRIEQDAGFRPDESFVANFFRLLGAAPLDAEVHFLPPLAVPAQNTRRAMAEAARAAIAARLASRQ